MSRGRREKFEEPGGGGERERERGNLTGGGGEREAIRFGRLLSWLIVHWPLGIAKVPKKKMEILYQIS